MRVAVLGCGTIGRGVVDILRNGVAGIELVKILDRKDRFVHEFHHLFTDDVNEILNDSSIDTVVEVMGGKDFSYKCVKSALENGKNVVSANKELIAYKMRELSELAEQKGVYLLYEASVGGGIPFVKTFASLSEFNKTNSIFGILNGTTNYILTKMQKCGTSYQKALKEAQKLGFAEADPTADVEGLDMVRKIAILSMLAYKQEIDIDSIYHFGITKVSEDFICFAKQLGYTLKFACYSSLKDNIDIGVEPVLVKDEDVVSNVDYETNIVRFDLEPNDDLTFIGKGAGRMPTAAAIVSDVMVIRDKGQKTIFKNINNYNVKNGLDKVSAVVEKDGRISLIEHEEAYKVRNGGYDFYAIIR